MRKKLLEEKKKLHFFATYGITHNRETIWQLVKRFDTVAASVRKTCIELNESSRKPEQRSMDFGPRSGWRTI